MTKTVIDLHHCKDRYSIRVEVANTPEAEAAFARFWEGKGMSYALDVWGRDDTEMEESYGNPGEVLAGILFPTCEHGMSYHSCYGPDHFMSRDQEMARGWY
jgi:hypothetical protein